MLVEAPVGVVTGTVDCLGDRTAAVQRGAHAARSMRRRVNPRRHASDGLENAMQMVVAEPGMFRQLVQAWRPFGLLNESAQLAHQGRVPHRQGRLVRLAALAGAKTRAQRIRRREVELHILGSRQPRGAAGPAENTGGFDRVETAAIGRRIASHDHSPARIAPDGGGAVCRGDGCGHGAFLWFQGGQSDDSRCLETGYSECCF